MNEARLAAEPPQVTSAGEPAQEAQVPPSAGIVPGWLAGAGRDGALAGIVQVELPEGALPWGGVIDEQVLRRRAQYTAGIELIASNFDALLPLAWHGDTIVLVFGGVPASEIPAHTFKAAQELWNRVRTELDLPVKLGAHVGRARVGIEAGTVIGADVEECARLAQAAPVGTIALSEELSLALPEAIKAEVTVLANRAGDERSIYAFPRSAVVATQPAPVVDEAPRLWARFRSYAAGPEVRLVRYVGFRLHKKEPPRLDIRAVFVPSEVEMRRRSDADQRRAEFLEGKHLPLPWSVQPAVAAGEGPRVFRELYASYRSIILLGDPGSGKTTLLRWLAVLAASGGFALDAELGVAERLLPLPVSVGRLAEIRRTLGGDTVSVPDALAGYFRGRSVHEDAVKLRDFLARELERGRCLVLLDGLDEVKSEERQAIYQWLESFAAEYAQNRFVVSSRVVGYTGFHLPGEVAEAVLRPFTEEQVERYVRGFHQAYVRWETGAEPADQLEADRLLSALRASPRLSALARNPFMLSALSLIHRAEGKLPRHRVQAYEVFARALCETWAEARRLVAGETRQPTIEYEEEALPILGELALAMHEQYPTGVAPEEFVIGKLAAALERQKSVSGPAAKRAAGEFLQRAGQEVQLLLERGAGEWGFLHLTFQEFFVAAGLHAAERFQEVAFQHLFDPRWEEVIRLGVGYLALVQKRPTAAAQFVKKVLEHEEPEPRRWMTRLLRKQVPLAALLAAEAGDALPMALQERIAAAFADWLKEMPREASGPVLKDLVLTDFVTRVVSACRGPLADPRAEVRARLVWGLGELGSAEAAGDLVAALSDADKEVRLAAEKAFEAVPVESPMTELAATLVDPRPEVRASAIKVLALLGVKLPLDELRGYLEDPNEGVRAAAVSAYKGRGREEALAAMDVVMKDASSEVRKELADELLVSVIGDVSPDVRAVAVSVLGRSDEGVTVCLDALKDSALDVRLAAAKMLASRKRREALGPLLDVFRERADKRYLAAKALGALGAEEAIEPLLAYVEDEGNEDRYSMIEAIGQLASSRHVERLENLLRGLPKPSAPADLVFAALWAIAEREARSLPGV